MVRTASSAKALARFTFFSATKQKLQALRDSRPNYREPGQDDRRVNSNLADDLRSDSPLCGVEEFSLLHNRRSRV